MGKEMKRNLEQQGTGEEISGNTKLKVQVRNQMPSGERQVVSMGKASVLCSCTYTQ